MSKPFGRYLEDFQQGEVIRHNLSKTITESDNNLFCLLTMNHHPLHLDAEYAAHTRFAQRVVVGTLVFSLAVGMSVGDISGKAVVNLGYEEVRHTHPVFIGDTLRAETEVLSVRASASQPGCGIARVCTRAYNQRGEQVIQFIRSILVPRREVE